MRLIRTIAFFALSFGAYFSAAQNSTNSIGLRLGQPLGMSYKKKFNNNKAFEIILGTGLSNWSKRYYEFSFYREYDRDDYTFRGHEVKNTFFIQGRYIFQNQIQTEGIKGNLEWFWGFGAMLKTAQVQYSFLEKKPPENHLLDKNDIDLGPEALIGMEYTFNNTPLTLYADISILIEIVNRPAYLRGFSAIGLRYNF
jgi:hypothetical protein